jgi:predicted DNA-binding protein YlxM (UPF0122 family)
MARIEGGNNMSVRKLTDAQARAAHKQVKKGLGPPEIAEKYGVSRSSIYDLCNGRADVVEEGRVPNFGANLLY